MTIKVDERGRHDIYAKEPKMYITEEPQVGFNERAERLNGRLAMIGIVAAIGAYALTGQILPGVF
jgi:hypothetical protein